MSEVTQWRSRDRLVLATRPRKLACALGGTVAVLAVLALLSTLEVPGRFLSSFSPEVPFSLPLLLTGGLLLASGLLLAWSVGDERRRPLGGALGMFLLLAGPLEAAALVGRAGDGASAAALGAGLAVGGALVAAAAFTLVPRPGVARPLATAGAAAWTLAKVLELAARGDKPNLVTALEGLLEMAGPAMLVLGLVLARRAQLEVAASEEEEGWGQLLRDLVAPAPAGTLAVAIGAAIGTFALAGLLFNRGLLSVENLDLNDEHVPPAVFSGLLLAAAGVLTLGFARLERYGAGRLRAPTVLGWFLLFLALDEVGALHDRLQGVTGLKGQVFLAPVVGLGFLGWLGMMRKPSVPTSGRAMLVGGGACWTIAQAIDLTQAPNDPFQLSIVPEETLEMIGSALLGFAVLAAAQAVLRSRGLVTSGSASDPEPGRSTAVEGGTASRA